MENYIGALIMIGVVVLLGVLYYAWSTGMFNGFTSSVSKNANGVIATSVNFNVVSPPAGQSYTFNSATTSDNKTVYVATIAVEITGDGNQLNGQYITIGTNTKGYYVIDGNVTISNVTLADIQSQPYAKYKINGTSGDYTFTVKVVSDHSVSTAGEQVTLQIKVGSTIKTVQIYAYPGS